MSEKKSGVFESLIAQVLHGDKSEKPKLTHVVTDQKIDSLSDDELAISDIFGLIFRKGNIKKQIEELQGELKSINTKLGYGRGQTKPDEKIRLFEESCELYQFVEARLEGKTEKDLIIEYIKNNRLKGKSKTENIDAEYEKLKKRLYRFKEEFRGLIS